MWVREGFLRQLDLADPSIEVFDKQCFERLSFFKVGMMISGQLISYTIIIKDFYDRIDTKTLFLL